MQSDTNQDKKEAPRATQGLREAEQKKSTPVSKAPTSFLSEINGIDVLFVFNLLSCR